MSTPLPGSPLPLPEIVEALRGLFPPESNLCLVGGAVRDALLGRPVHDLDIILPGDGVSAARRTADALQGACYPLDAERGVGRVIVVRGPARFTVDFAAIRGEGVEHDLTQRDFTINAIAVPLHRPQERIDPLGGERDVRAGIVRACTESAVSDDPVRAIRAVRLAAHLGFRIEPATKEQVRAASGSLARVSAERIRDELFRILAGPKVAVAVRSMESLGLLHPILPEIIGLEKVIQPPPHTRDVWNHTLLTVDRLECLLDLLALPDDTDRSADLTLGYARSRLGRFQAPLAEHLSRPLADERPVRGLLFLAALLHDAGKPDTRTEDADGNAHFLGHEHLGAEWALRRGMALRLSREETEYTAQIVRQHLRPLMLQRGGGATRRAVFRFFRSTGPCGVEVSLLSLADMLATYGVELPAPTWQALTETIRVLLEGYFEQSAEVVQPRLLLTGNDLIRDFDLLPGPQIGELLDALREAQAAGEVHTREEASALVARGLGRREA